MTAVLLVALWLAISVAVAAALAAALRTVRGVGLAEEVELYLRGIGVRRTRRPVALGLLGASLAAIALVLSGPLPGVAQRAQTGAIGTGEELGLAPRRASDAPAEPTADAPAMPTGRAASVAARRDTAPAGNPSGAVEAAGARSGPSGTSRRGDAPPEDGRGAPRHEAATSTAEQSTRADADGPAIENEVLTEIAATARGKQRHARDGVSSRSPSGKRADRGLALGTVPRPGAPKGQRGHHARPN